MPPERPLEANEQLEIAINEAGAEITEGRDAVQDCVNPQSRATTSHGR